MNKKHNSHGAQAIRDFQRAEEYRKRPARPGTCDYSLNQAETQRLQRTAEQLLQPEGELTRVGGEILHCDPATSDAQEPAIRDTLSEPNMISIDASAARLTSADDAGVLV